MATLDWLPRMLVVLTFGCMPAVGSSQATNTPAAPTIEGQVVDSVTGQPIARALVRDGNNDTLTDHEGRFSLQHDNRSGPMAGKPGYFAAASESHGTGPMLLRLAPEAILYGTVTDANSQPIQHLRIHLRRPEVRAGLASWQRTDIAVTNAEGAFRFAELMAGKYSLITDLTVDGLPDAAASLAFVPTVYPSPGSEEAGDGLTLRAGDHVEANLHLVADKLYPVSGVVHRAAGRGASVSVETLEGSTVNIDPHFFPDSGVFHFRLPRGLYRVKAQCMQGNQQFAGTREITVGPAGLEGVSIVLTSLPSIPVEVEYQRSGADRTEEPSPSSLSLSLLDDDSARVSSVAEPVNAGSGVGVPHAEDALVFRSVEPGHYVLQAQIPAPWYVASAACGNLDLTRDRLVASDGNGACSMRVMLRDDAASLQWSVANPGGSVTVMAFPLGNLAQTVGGANNSFDSNSERITGTMAGLAPGRYLVIAAQHNLDVPYRDLEELNKYLAWGKEVTLTPNSQSNIELEVAPESAAGEAAGRPAGGP